MNSSAPQYDYEKLQSFNRIVTWLHSFRYKFMTSSNPWRRKFRIVPFG